MLQMYGEKAEEAEELRLDIQDLKTMYRQQVGTVTFLPVFESSRLIFNHTCVVIHTPVLCMGICVASILIPYMQYRE